MLSARLFVAAGFGYLAAFGTHVLVRGLGFIAPISPPVTCLILPLPQVPSSTRITCPGTIWPSNGSCLTTIWAWLLLAVTRNAKTDCQTTCFMNVPPQGTHSRR